MLQSYITASICSSYVLITHHSPVNVYVTATYCVRSTPVYWSRLGWNSYGTNTYLHSSYSRSECLFRTRALATNLVTSLEIQPIRCAIMPCHFGQTPNGYVANYFILLSSTAARSATGGYVVVPEQLGQNEELAGSNKERTKTKPNFVPKVVLIDAVVFPSMWVCLFLILFVYFTEFCCLFNTFLLWKNSLIFCLCYYLLCWRGNKHFVVHFRRIRPVHFPSNDRKDAVCKGRKG